MKTLKERWKIVLNIAWPLIIANSFWNIQLTIDRIFLGSYSTESLGAAMAVMGVFWVPMALLQQTAAYVTTFVAQYYGASSEEKIGASFWQSVYVCLIGGILFLGLNFLSEDFFRFVGHSEKMQLLESTYFNSLAFSALPTALVAAISGFFTGLGKTKVVIWINFVGLLANVLFDYLLIFGNLGFEAYGIQGAGYATALAAYCGAAFGIFLLFKNEYEQRFKIRTSYKFNKQLTKQFLKFGIPSGLQWALEGLAFTVFLIIMGRLPNGEAALASSSIAVTIMMLSVLPTMGVGQAVLTLVGQKLGEKRADLAQVYTWDGVKISAIYISIVAISFWLIPEFYLSWFKNEENLVLWSEVSKLVPKLLLIIGVFTLFDSIYLNISFALKGAGDTKFVSLMALIIPWPIMVLPAFLLMNNKDAVILSWSFVILYMIILTGILTHRFTQGKWKSMSVI